MNTESPDPHDNCWSQSLPSAGSPMKAECTRSQSSEGPVGQASPEEEVHPEPAHPRWSSAHFGLVPGLSLSPALLCNQLILGFDLSNDAVQVQVAVVVHGQYHVGVRHIGLHLAQLL